MIWNPNKECMSREEMRALQGKRLQKLVNYVYHRRYCETPVHYQAGLAR